MTNEAYLRMAQPLLSPYYARLIIENANDATDQDTIIKSWGDPREALFTTYTSSDSQGNYAGARLKSEITLNFYAGDYGTKDMRIKKTGFYDQGSIDPGALGALYFQLNYADASVSSSDNQIENFQIYSLSSFEIYFQEQ